MALACQAFLEAGLDRIWQDLRPLEPLICCLPVDVWYDDRGKSLLEKALTRDHLERYLTFYAHRIRSLAPYSVPSKKGHMSSELLQAIQIATDHKHGVLSPCLKQFGRDSPGDPLDGYISLFPEETALYQSSLISVTTHLASRLKKLAIDVGCDANPAALLIESFRWTSLEELPLLRHLSIRDTVDTIDYFNPPESPSPTDFSSLHLLSVRGCWLSDIKKFFQAVPSGNKIEEVIAAITGPARVIECQLALSAVAEHGNHSTLRSIDIRDCVDDTPADYELEMYPGPSNQDQDLSCLSPFVNLQNLVVNLQANIQLSPRQVALIPT
ncbi:hypothetical protein FA13DRAFT_1731727 [Coprinellus micaceus]|uniref:F-box domain-containing protein n=1 Tax=Coprinellus micaceus TaxID=71717 RepID=A0A4Y7TEB5_COPMI|nr:hypothetical protein FA13DRAFT_1731727 [Coprinellus micaceus]